MRNKVVIAGLTAAGKTTHTRILARELGYPAIHVTAFLMEAVGVVDTADVWRQRMREVESLRAGGIADDVVDRRMLDVCARPGPLVIDAWALPWYGPQELVRIWIGSDRLSRTWKCAVSAMPTVTSEVEASALLDEKDGHSRVRFLDRYGFDLYQDRSVFDFVLDNSHLIDSPTRDSSDAGIAAFAPVVSAVARAGLNGDLGPVRELMETGTPDQIACLARIGSRPRGWSGYSDLPPLPRPVIPSRGL